MRLFDNCVNIREAEIERWKQKVNQFLKIGEDGRRLLSDLFIKSMFSISILSWSLRIWLDLNNGDLSERVSS